MVVCSADSYAAALAYPTGNFESYLVRGQLPLRAVAFDSSGLIVAVAGECARARLPTHSSTHSSP